MYLISRPKSCLWGRGYVPRMGFRVKEHLAKSHQCLPPFSLISKIHYCRLAKKRAIGGDDFCKSVVFRSRRASKLAKASGILEPTSITGSDGWL